MKVWKLTKVGGGCVPKKKSSSGVDPNGGLKSGSDSQNKLDEAKKKIGDFFSKVMDDLPKPKDKLDELRRSLQQQKQESDGQRQKELEE